MRSLAALLIGITGCTTMPLAVPPEPPPLPTPPPPAVVQASYAAPPAMPSDLPVPQAVADRGMTLDAAINRVLLADPKLRAGFEAINQASGDAVTASLRPNPTLGIIQSLLPLTRSFVVTDQGGPPQLDGYLSYSIDWFLFGKRAANMASAALGVQVSEDEYADLVRRRVGETAQAFYTVLEAKELLEVARQDAENLEGVVKATAGAVKSGGKPKVELSRVQVDLLNAQRVLRDARMTLATSKARLRALLGQTAGDPGFEVKGTLEAPPVDVPFSSDEAYAAALAQRPDLRAAHRKLRQAQAEEVAEERKGYPDLTVQAGLTRQFQKKAIGYPDASSYGGGMVMTIPLSNRNQGNRFKASSLIVQRQQELKLAMVEARAEIDAALAELLAARANSQAIGGQQLKVAASVRESITRAYKAGGRPLIDVLDARRTYRDTFRAAVASRAAYWRALYRFRTAIGQQVTTHDSRTAGKAPPAP